MSVLLAPFLAKTGCPPPLTVPPGQAQDFAFAADEPGDWAIHCHKTHYVLSGMAHNRPNVIGITPAGSERKARELLPECMLMGNKGGLMNNNMGGPENTLPISDPKGPFKDRIDISGMFTIVQVREGIESYEDLDGISTHLFYFTIANRFFYKK